MAAGTDSGKRGPIRNGDPADDLFPVTKSDTLDVWGNTYSTDTIPGRGLLVGTAGTATIITARGTTRTDVPLQLGWNPVRVKQVKNAGTASNIWAVPA